jgi:hypothetical protein
MATSPRFTKSITKHPTVVILPAAAGVITTIVPANATIDSRVNGITVSTDDSAIQNLTLYINDGVTDCPVGTLPIPIGAGITVSIPAIDIIAALPSVFRERDSNGVTIYNLPATFSLKVKVALITAGKTFYIRPHVELYD